MQLQVDVNNLKSNIFLEMLNLFKKDNMINDYKIIDDNNYDNEVINDLKNLNIAIKDAQNGLGEKTSKTVTIENF